MSKGRYESNKETGKKWILLLVLIVFAVAGGPADDAVLPSETQGAESAATNAAETDTAVTVNISERSLQVRQQIQLSQLIPQRMEPRHLLRRLKPRKQRSRILKHPPSI